MEASEVVRRKGAGCDGVERRGEHGRGRGRVAAGEAGAASFDHLLGAHAEDEDIVGADVIADFDIGAVERADGERTVERELHVAGARGFHAGGRYLLRQVGGRDDRFGEADIVVRQEDHLEPVPHQRVVVDDARDVVRQLDDELGAHIAGRGLAGEDLHPRRPVLLRVGADRLVERDRFEDVEELTLVFVDALDLHVEQRSRVDANAGPRPDHAHQRVLVGALDQRPAFDEARIAGESLQADELCGIVEDAPLPGYRSAGGSASGLA